MLHRWVLWLAIKLVKYRGQFRKSCREIRMNRGENFPRVMGLDTSTFEINDTLTFHKFISIWIYACRSAVEQKRHFSSNCRYVTIILNPRKNCATCSFFLRRQAYTYAHGLHRSHGNFDASRVALCHRQFRVAKITPAIKTTVALFARKSRIWTCRGMDGFTQYSTLFETRKGDTSRKHISSSR